MGRVISKKTFSIMKFCNFYNSFLIWILFFNITILYLKSTLSLSILDWGGGKPFRLYNDSAYPFQIGFQDGSSPSLEGITELHDSIFFYLIVISFLVFWVLSSVILHFNNNKAQIVHKYNNHGLKFFNKRKITGLCKNKKQNFHTYCKNQNIKIFKGIIALKGNLSSHKNNKNKALTEIKKVHFPLVNTLSIQKGKIVIQKMLNYLDSINSPLFSFLIKHEKFQKSLSLDLTISIYSKEIKGKKIAIAYLSELMNKKYTSKFDNLTCIYVLLKNNTKAIDLFYSIQDFYIGSTLNASDRYGVHQYDLSTQLKTKKRLS